MKWLDHTNYIHLQNCLLLRLFKVTGLLPGQLQIWLKGSLVTPKPALLGSEAAQKFRRDQTTSSAGKKLQGLGEEKDCFEDEIPFELFSGCFWSSGMPGMPPPPNMSCYQSHLIEDLGKLALLEFILYPSMFSFRWLSRCHVPISPGSNHQGALAETLGVSCASHAAFCVAAHGKLQGEKNYMLKPVGNLHLPLKIT